MAVKTDTPRVYVASLSDYNAGKLLGTWIDATQEPEEIWARVQAMLTKSTEDVTEEWAIHDYDGFHGVSLSEYESFEKVSELAQAIEEHGAAYGAYVAMEGVEYATPEGFEEAYAGHHDSEEDFAQEFAEEIGVGEPKEHTWPQSYIDWERAARDLFLGDYYSAEAPGGGIYVFRRL